MKPGPDKRVNLARPADTPRGRSPRRLCAVGRLGPCAATGADGGRVPIQPW